MPWLMNCGRTSEMVVLSDGSSKSFPARKRVYVPLAMMTPEIGEKVRRKIFVSYGGDPVSHPKKVQPVLNGNLDLTQKATDDASSVHHQEHDILPSKLEVIANEDTCEVEKELASSDNVVETVAVAAVEVEAGSQPGDGSEDVQGFGGYRSRKHRRRHPV